MAVEIQVTWLDECAGVSREAIEQFAAERAIRKERDAARVEVMKAREGLGAKVDGAEPCH